MRTCATCKAELVELEVSPPGQRRPSRICRRCRADYHRRWYEKNRAKVIAKSARRNEAHRGITREIVLKAKARPCTDCGHQFPPEAMDFDHVRGVKANHVSRLLHVSIERLLAEIEKCDVVCANCHRIRTARRLIARGVKVRSFREEDLLEPDAGS